LPPSVVERLCQGAVAAPVAGCRFLPPLQWHGARVKRLECVSMGLDDEDDDEKADEGEVRGEWITASGMRV